MDPELLLRVGKPEKYSPCSRPTSVMTASIDLVSLCVLGPDNIGLVLECSPRSFLSPDFVLAAIDSGVATLRDLIKIYNLLSQSIHFRPRFVHPFAPSRLIFRNDTHTSFRSH